MRLKFTFIAPVTAAACRTRDSLVWSELTCISVTFLMVLDASCVNRSATATHGLTAASLAVAKAGALT